MVNYAYFCPNTGTAEDCHHSHYGPAAAVLTMAMYDIGSVTALPSTRGMQIARKQQVDGSIGDGLTLELTGHRLGCLKRAVLSELV